jgi:diguanylate cyclase (GGDEF)-like protein
MRAELGPRTVGRIAAGLFAASGLLSAFSIVLPRPPGMNTQAVFYVSVLAVVAGGLAYIAPWDTWARPASLALIPVAFALIALGNAYGSTRPYTYSVFFIVAFAWIGMSQTRWTSVWFAPLAAVAYVLPMLVRPGAERGDAAGAAVVVPVSVLVAELIAWIVAGERRNRKSAHALVRLAYALGQHLDEARLSQTLVDEARHALGSEHAVLFQIDPISMTVTDVHGSSVPEPVSHVLERLPGTKLDALPSEIIGGDPMVVTHSENDSTLINVVLRYGVKSYVAVPVMARGSLVGVLACWETSHHRAYSDQDLALARALAGQASAAIENARLYERTLEAARCDHLTGLANRRAFRERLETEVERARRYGRELSLIVIDCDKFKRINDTLGHQAGDRVLERIGEMLLRNRRLEDGAFRIGGDEFALLLPETSAEGASTLAERLRRTLERAALGTNREAPLTASLGVSAYGTRALNADDLFESADGALYEVKACGGNATALASDSGNGNGRHHLGVDIQTVVDNELLYALYQPIFELPTGDVRGFETFVRLDPACGHTPTSTLFRAAAGAGLLDSLDRICRRTALASAQDVASTVEIFLNVTPAALAADWAVAEDICLQIDRQGLPRGRVVIEVTEHERSSSSRALLRNLRACQHEGVRIGMGDFTAAPSDLDLLAAIGFDYVKVDMGFVHGTADIDSRRAVLRALCVLIRETGAQPIAQGVETVEDLRLVRDLGFVAAQGFLLRAPASLPDLSPRPLYQLLAPEPVPTG